MCEKGTKMARIRQGEKWNGNKNKIEKYDKSIQMRNARITNPHSVYVRVLLLLGFCAVATIPLICFGRFSFFRCVCVRVFFTILFPLFLHLYCSLHQHDTHIHAAGERGRETNRKSTNRWKMLSQSCEKCYSIWTICY